SVVAPAGWNCVTPPVGGTGTITCTDSADLLAGVTATFTVVVNVDFATPDGTIITNTASGASSVNDPNPANNSASTATLVTAAGAPCTITCSPNITVSSSNSQCGAVVKYSLPVTSGACGAVTCLPPSSSFFPVGATFVSCQGPVGPSCTFL